MSKPQVQHHESTNFDSPSTSSSRQSHPNNELLENGTSSQRPVYSNVRRFVDEHGLSAHFTTFRKASLILQGEVAQDEIPDLTDSDRQNLHDETTRKWRQPTTLYFTVMICSLGAVEQGWAQTGMNGANLTFPKAFGIDSKSKHDTFVIGLINSGIYLSAGLVGAWLSDPVNNRLARRGAVMLGSFLCLIANLGSAISTTWIQLLLFRCVLGIGLGLDASTVSVLQAECAPAQIRGGLAVQWQMWTAFGVFLGFVANTAFYNFGDSTWRWQLGAPFIPTVPLLCLIYVCPESPAWYIKHGNRYDRAFQSLCRLRNAEILAAKEIYSSYLQNRVKAKALEQESSFLNKLYDLVTVPRIRRATIASYVVMLSQQLCGINIIAFYSSTIFADAGFSTFGALVASCVFGFVNFIGAFPAIWSMDSFGRRSLLLLTLPLMAMTMLAAGISFKIPPEHPAHFGLLSTLIYLFCALYSPGMGPVPNTYSAEVFPLSHREIGMSMAVATANFWAALLSLTFPRILTALGATGAFTLYAVLNAVALVLIFLFLPETRLKTLDELDDVFSISSRIFMRYQLRTYLPWLWRRFVLRNAGAELKPLETGQDYQELEQDETEDE